MTVVEYLEMNRKPFSHNSQRLLLIRAAMGPRSLLLVLSVPKLDLATTF